MHTICATILIARSSNIASSPASFGLHYLSVVCVCVGPLAGFDSLICVIRDVLLCCVYVYIERVSTASKQLAAYADDLIRWLYACTNGF